jgi:hypothetical protein
VIHSESIDSFVSVSIDVVGTRPSTQRLGVATEVFPVVHGVDGNMSGIRINETAVER